MISKLNGTNMLGDAHGRLPTPHVIIGSTHCAGPAKVLGQCCLCISCLPDLILVNGSPREISLLCPIGSYFSLPAERRVVSDCLAGVSETGMRDHVLVCHFSCNFRGFDRVRERL